MGVLPLAVGAADGTQVAVKTVMMVVVSLVVLAAAVRIVLKRDGYDEGTKQWALAAIGTIIGFWLKG
jgi:hypothetical protein